MNLPQNANPHLVDRDFTVIIDRSGSMADPALAGKARTRWEASEEATIALARECNKYDPDGITVYTFGSNFHRFDNTTESKVGEIFRQVRPNGSTRLAEVLEDAFFGANGYIARKKRGQAKKNGELFCVVTDGQPDDQQAVADVIIRASHELTDPNEVNITFIQVGDDRKAKEFLVNLDDKLEAPEGQQGNSRYAKYDIVDTLTIDQLGGKDLTEVLVAAVTEHKQSV
jgi:uncharacterized protein YegL